MRQRKTSRARGRRPRLIRHDIKRDAREIATIASPSVGSAAREVSQACCGTPSLAGRRRPSWKLNSRDEQTGPCLMESRTDTAAVGFGNVVPPSERSSKSADRLTPAQPVRDLVESDFAEATPGLHTGTARQLCPQLGRSLPRSTLTTRHRAERGRKQTMGSSRKRARCQWRRSERAACCTEAHKMKVEEIRSMKRAIAAYDRPVTRCPPGIARAKALRKVVGDAAARWLRGRRHDVPAPKPDDQDIERRRRRKARAERKGMRRAANAAARKMIRAP